MRPFREPIQGAISETLPKPPWLTASVALATFNGANYIEEQLQSIMAQTAAPREIVVCDDGSSDGTVAIVRKLASATTTAIRVFENPERLGYRRNFMKAGALCTGDVVFFSDQDDIWARNKIATMLPFFTDEHVQLAYHNAEVFYTGLTKPPYILYNDRDHLRGISPRMPNPFHFSQGFTQAYRRDLHRFDDLWETSVDHFEPDKPLAHDQWFFFLAFLLGEVRYSAKALAAYRQHGSNAYGAQTALASTPKEVQQARSDSGRRQRGYVSACMACARIASEINVRSGSRMHNRPAVLSRRYSTLAKRIERRIQTIEASDLGMRLSALTSNVLDGAYGGSQTWRLRTQWLPKDILRALSGIHSRSTVPRLSAGHE